MKKVNRFVAITITITTTISAILAMVLMVSPQHATAATNAAGNVAGGSHTLTGSGNVTVNSSSLALAKQVYDSAGTCLASSPADAACNGGATSVNVPTGTTLKFLIFVKNPTSVALTDIRFQDALDVTATGFAYVASTIRRTQTGAAAPVDTATAAAIFADANGGTGTALTDVASGTDEASFVSPNLTAGQATNGNVTINANKAFGIVFQVTKN